MSHSSGRRRKRTLDGFVPSNALKRLLVGYGGVKATKAFAAGNSVVLSTHPAAVAARAAVKDTSSTTNNNNTNNHLSSSKTVNNSVATPTASATIVTSPATTAASRATVGVQRDAGRNGHSHMENNSNSNINRATPIITRLVTLDSMQRKALQVTATKLKRSADATRDDLEKHQMYLEAGLAFLEHAVAHRDEKVQMHLLKTVADFLNNLLSLAEGVRDSFSVATGVHSSPIDAIIVLYLKLSCLTRFRRFGMNANKISRIRDSLSRQARQQQEEQHTRKQQQRHGHFGSSSGGGGVGQKPSAVEDATRNSYVDYMVSEIKDPMAALQAYDRSETLRARGLAMGAAAAGGKNSRLFKSMQAVPTLSSYAAPEVVEECVAELRHALEAIKSVNL